MSDLPAGPILAAFERGQQPANIAEAFGADVKDVNDVLIAEMRLRGMTDDEIAGKFGAVWGL